MRGRRRRGWGAAALALAAASLIAGCHGQEVSPGAAHAREEATTDPQEGEFLLDEALFALSTVDQVVTGTLETVRPSKDDEYLLATLTSPSLARPAPVLLRRDWGPRAGVSATFATVPATPEAIEVMGLPAGTLQVHLASPDLGPGVSTDEPGRIWAAYRVAMPSVSDVELARAIVAGAKANRAEQPAIGSSEGSTSGSGGISTRGGAQGSAAGRAMAAALLRAFGSTTTSAAPTTSASGPSVLPDGVVEPAPAGTVSGRIVLLLPSTETYRWVAVRFPGDRFTVPTNVMPGGIVDVLTAVPLGQAGAVVTWAAEEPQLDQATPLSTVPALTAPQSVIRVVPQGLSVITDQGAVTQVCDVDPEAEDLS